MDHGGHDAALILDVIAGAMLQTAQPARQDETSTTMIRLQSRAAVQQRAVPRDETGEASPRANSPTGVKNHTSNQSTAQSPARNPHSTIFGGPHIEPHGKTKRQPAEIPALMKLAHKGET